jgi:hypothetical protein
VATETMEILREKAARLVTVDFASTVEAPPSISGCTFRSCAGRQWILEVSGPLGPLMQAVSALPVHDIRIEPFKLEDYIAGFYGMDLKA